ncbi:hypothetical protein VNO77_25513 [Canavalia gladiata]|uniref:Uncharacterized protein n=1 Tax=Canavalia gladiata TaxID=3824 RepID=A0AAN9L8U8_CANGL
MCDYSSHYNNVYPVPSLTQVPAHHSGAVETLTCIKTYQSRSEIRLLMRIEVWKLSQDNVLLWFSGKGDSLRLDGFRLWCWLIGGIMVLQ